MNKKSNKFIATVGILTAVEIVLAYISNFVPGAFANLNLALIPIIVAACICGPYAGLFLGVINGIITIISPSTLTYFFAVNPIATIFTCILKTGLAGFITGLLYQKLKSETLIKCFLVAILVPVINTSIFIIFVLLFFMSIYGTASALFVAIFSTNFLIELIISIACAPVIYKFVTNKK